MNELPGLKYLIDFFKKLLCNENSCLLVLSAGEGYSTASVTLGFCLANLFIVGEIGNTQVEVDSSGELEVLVTGCLCDFS